MIVEPSTWQYLQTPLLNYAFPFASFFLGTFISTRLEKGHDFSDSQVWLMSIPTSIFVIGMLMMTSAIPPSSGEVIVDGFKYAFTSSFHQLMVFCGFLMFSGTIVPFLFTKIQRDVTKQHRETKLPPL